MIAITANSWKNNTLFLSLTIGLMGFLGCAKMPTYTQFPSTQLKVGLGPEDIVMDSLVDAQHPRLLVSCAARRKTDTPEGNIWSLDLETDQAQVLPRKGEPEGLGIFHPHGIDIVKRNDGKVILYVINHQDSLKRQLIMSYEVFSDHLQFIQANEHILLSSPNDVCFDPQGGFYWSNDASSRKNAFIEPILGIKGGYVGHLSDNRTWSKSKSKFAYTNGIGVLNGDLYISTVIQSKVFRFKQQDISAKPELICKLVGGDNISFTQDGKLLVTAHLRQIKFLRHMKNPAVKSPSVVYLVDPLTKEKKVIFADDGNQISTASTAIWYKDHLYISQIFDGFILKVKTGIR